MPLFSFGVLAREKLITPLTFGFGGFISLLFQIHCKISFGVMENFLLLWENLKAHGWLIGFWVGFKIVKGGLLRPCFEGGSGREIPWVFLC